VGALVLLVAFLLLALVTYVVFPLGAAGNDRARARTAADAAALAGAEEIRTTWLNTQVLPGLLVWNAGGTARITPPVTPSSGSGAASGYAASNGSQITRYNASPATGRVAVVTRANHTSNENTTQRATSAATAEMDIDFSTCTWSVTVQPPQPPAPGGVPTFPDTLTCGSWSADYLINNVGPTLTISWVGKQMPQLYDDLEPRLVE
jgi:hypothetical protein